MTVDSYLFLVRTLTVLDSKSILSVGLSTPES
jgi:hypothetical protein